MEISRSIVVRNGHPVGFQRNSDVTLSMRQAAALVEINTALASAGYDARHNQRLCREELSVRQTVLRLNPHNSLGRWPKAPYRRAMQGHFV